MAPRALPGLGLSGFWGLGEDGYKDAMDVNWRLLSALVQARVLSRTTALPGSPTDGDIYIVPHGAGAHPDEIAIRDNGAWVYVTPLAGYGMYVIDSTERVTFDGTNWTASASSATLDTDGTLAANSDTRVATQKAVKTYVDSRAVSLGTGAIVRAATTANITIATDLNNGDTLDGVTLATGEYVLVKNQTAAAENGIYVVGASPARASEFDTFNEHPGSIISVQEGTSNDNTIWLCTTNKGGTLGSSAINYQQMVLTGTVPSSRQVTAGTGMTGGGDLSADRTLAVDKATAGNIQAGTNNKVVTADGLIAAAAPQTLTDGATINWDLHSGFNAKVTLGGNRTMAAPTNPHVGMTYLLEVIQDATGGRTMTWNACFDWGSAGAPTLSTGASKHDLVTLYCYDDSTPKFRAAFNKAA